MKLDLKIENIDDLPTVTVGIVNCNRLFYLKSCLESFLECTDDYPNREIIIVDNASSEEGTAEYLMEKEAQGIRVIRMEKRDPSNEFAKGLNTIVRESTGDYVILLQGDMQFVVNGKWLHRYVELYQRSEDMIGCICLDAQRSVTHASHRLSDPAIVHDFGFVADYDRSPISGAGDVMYSRRILEKIGPWSEENSRHEVNDDSETKMLKRIQDVLHEQDLSLACALPVFPPAIAIYTDARGTNARVRGNRRYGDYWPAKEGHKYYKIYDYDSIVSEGKTSRKIPMCIEEVAVTLGYDPPINNFGVWLKNPIRPETANSNDWVTLDITEEVTPNDNDNQNLQEEFISEWLDS